MRLRHIESNSVVFGPSARGRFDRKRSGFQTVEQRSSCRVDCGRVFQWPLCMRQNSRKTGRIIFQEVPDIVRCLPLIEGLTGDA
jgi:hypothetical protein